MKWRRPSLWILLILICEQYAVPHVIKVDACEILGDPVLWNGVMVRASGQLQSSSGEGGPWLSGKDCKSELLIKGERFANIIQLTDPQNDSDRIHRVEYTWDERSRSELRAAVAAMRTSKERFDIEVVGTFETRVPLTLLINENARFKDHGFGHMGAAPAQILVKSIVVRASRH